MSSQQWFFTLFSKSALKWRGSCCQQLVLQCSCSIAHVLGFLGGIPQVPSSMLQILARAFELPKVDKWAKSPC